MSNDDGFLRIAYVLDAHGLNGRLKVAVISDNPGRFDIGASVYLELNGLYSLYTVADFNFSKRRTALLQLKEVLDRNQAESLRGAGIFITKEEAERTRDELDNDSFYYYDIIGCDVYLDNSLFAKVTDIMNSGGGDILVIKDTDGRELLLPFVESMADTSRMRERRIDISPVEGLFDI
ncbi:MAG: ribosome maturation factor RimM [Spirochaetia bacterium]|nr:ribosome maturation factor RimM [Spirochaetia bacterium]